MSQHATATNRPTFDVYVGNLPPSHTEGQIRDIFSVAGEIVGVKILPLKQGATGKVAFVKFAKEADALCVAQYMSNHCLTEGRNLSVKYGPTRRSTSAAGNGTQVNAKFGEQSTAVITKPKVDETVVVYVANVASPIEFSGQLYNKELASKLGSLTERMEALCPSQAKVVGQLSMETVYGCKFSLDGLWYRCRIQKCLPKNEVDVRYIDYGNSEVTDRFGLVSLPPDISNLAPLCDLYCVDELELVDRSTSSDLYNKGVSMLTELISEQRIEIKIRKIEKRKMHVKIIRTFNGPLLDIAVIMMTTGAVKIRNLIQAAGMKSTIKSPVKDKSPAVTPKSSAEKKKTPAAILSPAREAVVNQEEGTTKAVQEQSPPEAVTRKLFDEREKLENSDASGKVTGVQCDEKPAVVCEEQGEDDVLQFDDSLTKKVQFAPPSTDPPTDLTGEDVCGDDGVNGYLPSEDIVEQDASSNLTKASEENDYMSPKKPAADGTIVVYVSNVASPIDFSGQMYNKELAAKMCSLTERMEALCPSQPTVVAQLSTETLYGCKFSLDGMWYRCRVQKCLPNDQVNVRYIDYGNCEVTDRFGLVTLPLDISSLSPLCEHYCVDELELVDRSISSDLYCKGVSMLSKLISEQRIEMKIQRKEKHRTCVKIMGVLNGAVLDVPEALLATESVRLRTPPPHTSPNKTTFSLVDEPDARSNLLQATESDSMSPPTLLDIKLEKYVTEIEEKREEIEQLKEKLREKTKLIDSCLKRVPKPGCKRDLYQVYGEHDTATDIFTSRNEAPVENVETLRDIGGYKKELAELRALLVLPFHEERLFEDVGIKPSRGILLCGAQGSGKGMMARAISSEVKASFIEIYGPSLMCATRSNNSLVEAFHIAKNRRAIIFIDELDKVAPKVGTEQSKAFVAHLLTLWAGLKGKSYIIIATVNNSDNLDPALKRFGLFDAHVNIAPPDLNDRLDMLSIMTKNMNLHTDVSLRKVAEETCGYVASDLAILCRIAGMQVIRRRMEDLQRYKERGFLLGKDCVSGVSFQSPGSAFQTSDGSFQSLISFFVSMDDFKHALCKTNPSVPVENVSGVKLEDIDDEEVMDICQRVRRLAVVKQLKDHDYASLKTQQRKESSEYLPVATGGEHLQSILASAGISIDSIEEYTPAAVVRQDSALIEEEEQSASVQQEKQSAVVRQEEHSALVKEEGHGIQEENQSAVVRQEEHSALVEEEGHGVQEEEQSDVVKEDDSVKENNLTGKSAATSVELDSYIVIAEDNQSSHQSEINVAKEVIDSEEQGEKGLPCGDAGGAVEAVEANDIEACVAEALQDSDEVALQDSDEVALQGSDEVATRTREVEDSSGGDLEEVTLIQHEVQATATVVTHHDLTSDGEGETLNESFESCDSNLDEDNSYCIGHEEGDVYSYVAQDAGDSSHVTQDEGDNVKSLDETQDGDEVEAWNTALLTKKTRDPTEATQVDYDNEGFF